jgi:hypothetical protein
VRRFAVLVRSGCVLFGVLVLPHGVVMFCLMVMMSGSVMMSGRLMVMLPCGMLRCSRHLMDSSQHYSNGIGSWAFPSFWMGNAQRRGFIRPFFGDRPI